MRGNQEDQQGTCIASTPENDLRDRRGRLGGLIGGLLGALPYVALTLGSAAVSTTVSAESVLEEVIVTARKRDESIQDVPVAVTSITKELKQASVRRLEDIQSFAPNTFIRRSPGVASGASISIRGVGTLDTDKSLDPAIGVMMDGMFLGTASGVLLQNFDIERIEVLRGPQGILFGKNTTGGMINVIRGRVTMEAGADVSMAVDGNGRQDIKAVVNLPVIEDKLGIKLFGAQIKSDGFVYNSTLDEDVGGDDIKTYGLTTLWEPSDTFNLKLHYEKFFDDSDQGAYVNLNQQGLRESYPDGDYILNDAGAPVQRDELACRQGFCAFNSLDGPDRNSADGRNFSDNEYDTFILTSNLDLGNFLLTYIATSRDMDEDNNQHFDGSAAKTLSMEFYNLWHQKSHELRVTSQFSDTVEFVAGIYKWDVDYEQRWDVRDLFPAIFAEFGLDRAGQVSRNGQNQTTESSAVFFSGDWHVTDRLTLSAGARWTEEEKNFIGGNGGTSYCEEGGTTFCPEAEPIPGLNNPVSYSAKWSNTSPMVGARFQVSEDIMVFGSYTEGFKSGGFFGRQANFDIDASYQPEYIDSYELGMKSTLMDGRMRFNPTLFLAKYKDKQESILVPVSIVPPNVATVVRNASVLDMFGVELELLFQVNDAFFVRATYGYLDAEYDNYLADLTGDQIVTDNSALVPRNAPENTLGLTGNYITSIGNGDLSAVVSWRYRDEAETIADNNALGHLDSITELSANVSYAWSDNRYRVTVFGRNMTDQRERKAGIIGGFTTRGWWNEGSTYGVELSASF